MSEEKKYLSANEYAKIHGVSLATVYNWMKTKLKKYVIIIDNKRYIDIEAENINDSREQKAKKDTNNDQESVLKGILKELEYKNRQIEELTTIIENLRNQITEKDLLISNYIANLQEQETKLLNLLEQSQELQKNNQILVALQQEQRKKLLEQENKRGLFGWIKKHWKK